MKHTSPYFNKQPCAAHHLNIVLKKNVSTLKNIHSIVGTNLNVRCNFEISNKQRISCATDYKSAISPRAGNAPQAASINNNYSECGERKVSSQAAAAAAAA